MKLIYILSQAHSGSTLIDCILGTHPDFCSSGELRYLNWQLERTINVKPSIEAQDICTCGNNWRECDFWNVVFERIKEETGVDIVNYPHQFDTKYFGQYSYKDRGGHKRRFIDRALGAIFRIWLERGGNLSTIAWLKPNLKKQINNNWKLYELMSDVSERSVVVDSTKHLLISLLLQQFRSKDVYILFLHRDILRLAASRKKLSIRSNKQFSIEQCKRDSDKFRRRVSRYKKSVKDLKYIECFYDDVVEAPSDFLDKVVKTVNASNSYDRQTNSQFWIDPSKLHLVAGNPMRYRGRQLVRADDSWKTVLTRNEVSRLKS